MSNSILEAAGMAAGALAVILVVLLITAVLAIGGAVSGLILGALLYLFGIVGIGTVKAIVLWFYAGAFVLRLLQIGLLAVAS